MRSLYGFQADRPQHCHHHHQQNAASIDEQCSVASFDMNQPLVSTRTLNGSMLDNSTAEDDLTAMAAGRGAASLQGLVSIYLYIIVSLSSFVVIILVLG
jgi:hypothetical protein